MCRLYLSRLKEIEETMNNLQEELQQLESALEDQEGDWVFYAKYKTR